MLNGPEPVLDMGEEPRCRRTAPLALLSVHVGFASLTLMTSVPVGGFELKLTQVLLQPVAVSQKSSAAVRRARGKAFIAAPPATRMMCMAEPHLRHYRGGRK